MTIRRLVRDDGRKKPPDRRKKPSAPLDTLTMAHVFDRLFPAEKPKPNAVPDPFFDVHFMPAQAKSGTFSPGKSGALTSGSDHLGFIWQTPVSLLDSLARRVERGAKPKDKKDPYPIFNWRQGLSDPAFIRARFGNFARHAFKVANGDQDWEDDIQGNVDAITWFCMFINEALRLHPEAVAEAFYAEPRGERYNGD